MTAVGGVADLRLAVRRGYMVLPVPGLGGVELRGGVVCYDPAIRQHERAHAVCRLTSPETDAPK